MGALYKTLQTVDADFYRKKKRYEANCNKNVSNDEFIKDGYMPISGGGKMNGTGTSVFDPVLCETQYLWFTAKGDKIIDPFAGGSVRGIVAVELGRQYVGIDLRKEQVDANIENAEICTGDKPVWICGDSTEIKTLAKDEYDFLFTCPPYGDLEKYSDDHKDISNMSNDDFDKTYLDIMCKAATMVKQDRFASVVVGNYRDKNGFLRDLVGLTITAMEKGGFRYYNDFVFITPCGSLPIRTGKQFNSARKAGKTHQYCLNFVKGDPKKATERLGDIEIPDLDQYMSDEDYGE